MAPTVIYHRIHPNHAAGHPIAEMWPVAKLLMTLVIFVVYSKLHVIKTSCVILTDCFCSVCTYCCFHVHSKYFAYGSVCNWLFFVDRKELITGKMCTIVNDVCILKNVSSQNGNCSKLKLILLLTFYIAFVFFDCYAIYCLFYPHLSSAVKKLSAP